MRKKVTGSENQQKEPGCEQAKQPTTCEGEQSKQQSEHDIFSLLAEIQELTKTISELERQKKENERLKEMEERIKQIKIQLQQLKEIYNSFGTREIHVLEN